MFDNYVTDIELDGKPIQLALWDTAGQEEYERLRPLSYSKAHIILIAYSVDTPDSLDNVTQKVSGSVSEGCECVSRAPFRAQQSADGEHRSAGGDLRAAYTGGVCGGRVRGITDISRSSEPASLVVTRLMTASSAVHSPLVGHMPRSCLHRNP